MQQIHTDRCLVHISVAGIVFLVFVLTTNVVALSGKWQGSKNIREDCCCVDEPLHIRETTPSNTFIIFGEEILLPLTSSFVFRWLSPALDLLWPTLLFGRRGIRVLGYPCRRVTICVLRIHWRTQVRVGAGRPGIRVPSGRQGACVLANETSRKISCWTNQKSFFYSPGFSGSSLKSSRNNGPRQTSQVKK